MEFKYFSEKTKLDKDWFQQAYESLLSHMKTLVPESSTDAWLELMERWNELKMIVESERSRTEWDESLDAHDGKAAARASQFRGQVQPLVTEHDATLRRAILENPPFLAKVRELFGELLVARWECEEIARNPINIQLDIADEELSTRYHMLRGKAQVPVGEKSYTLTELENLLEHNEENVRENAFHRLMGWYRENRAELDSIFLEMVKLRNQAGRNLGFDDFVPLAYKRMSRLDYGAEETARFRSQVLAYVTPVVRLLRAEQAKPFGGVRVKPWNRNFLPQYALHDGEVKAERQLEGVKEIYRRLDPRLADHFQRMIDLGLIDLENRPGKRGGAFCTEMPDRDEVRIFCNSTGIASDIWTILHESGHAFQGWESQWIKAFELRGPTMEAAEIHSMGMEFLAYPHLSIFFEPDDERSFKNEHLVKALQFLCYACVVDGFQHRVYHEQITNAQDAARIWKELWSQFMGGEDWTGYEQELETFWHHKLHIFGAPFYYIDYALAQICALQLWRLSMDDPHEALERYLTLCQLGGTKSFSLMVREAGLEDPFGETALQNVLDGVRNELQLQGKNG